MKVAFIARKTLFTNPGGDTIQLTQTAKHLGLLGIQTEIKLANEKLDYTQYDLFHFFNAIRPADILRHIHKTDKPFALSPLLVDYSEYDKKHRKGFAGKLFSFLSSSQIEYLKTIARWVKGKDAPVSFSYIWKGHRKSMKEVLSRAGLILPNSKKEAERIKKEFGVNATFCIVPNGIDASIFQRNGISEKDPTLVLCAARIEGLKNQLNLIKALNNSRYRLLLIGNASQNQPAYYRLCKRTAAPNVSFIGSVSQEQLAQYYRKAAVHVLPSWFETCGLSSLEAAAMGCNIVISSKGYASEYFGPHAWYCDPASPTSILNAVESAAHAQKNGELQQKIYKIYTWEAAALKTAEAYKSLLH